MLLNQIITIFYLCFIFFIKYFYQAVLDTQCVLHNVSLHMFAQVSNRLHLVFLGTCSCSDVTHSALPFCRSEKEQLISSALLHHHPHVIICLKHSHTPLILPSLLPLGHIERQQLRPGMTLLGQCCIILFYFCFQIWDPFENKRLPSSAFLWLITNTHIYFFKSFSS